MGVCTDQNSETGVCNGNQLRLWVNTTAQLEEFIILTGTVGKRNQVNTYTNSKYTHSILHAHAAFWRRQDYWPPWDIYQTLLDDLGVVMWGPAFPGGCCHALPRIQKGKRLMILDNHLVCGAAKAVVLRVEEMFPLLLEDSFFLMKEEVLYSPLKIEEA